MFVKDLYVESRWVKKAHITDSVKEALDIIEKEGYRCIPVVGENDEYRGMIYKIHLKEFLYEGDGNPESSIEGIVKHTDEFIDEGDSFVKALLRIKALPFLSVVKDGRLIGILTHNKVMGVLEDSLGLATGGYMFTLSSFETPGVIERVGNLLKNENIEGLFTLDNGSKLIRRIVFTVGKERTEEQIEALKKKIEKENFRVLHIEKY